MLQQAVLAMNLQEQLSLCSDEEDSDDDDANEGEACGGGKSEDVYDDGEFIKIVKFSILTTFFFRRLNGSNA
jgi:hypothetical protein